MAAKASTTTDRLSVTYCKHEFDPTDTAIFVRLDGFTKAWEKLGFDALDMKVLRAAIATRPGPIIQGTGGIRKIRFRRSDSSRGKSAGIRVCYAFFPKYSVGLLIKAYPKNHRGNITDAEKKLMRKELKLFEASLENGPIH